MSTQVPEELHNGLVVKSLQELSPLVAGCKVSTQVPEEWNYGLVVKSPNGLSPSPLVAGCKVSTQVPEELHNGLAVKSLQELSPLVAGCRVSTQVPKEIKFGLGVISDNGGKNVALCASNYSSPKRKLSSILSTVINLINTSHH